MLLRTLFALLLLTVVSACSSMQGPGGSSSIGEYKVGNPYQVNGEWYTPSEDYGYDETGLASWYGAEFGGKRTANGEIFDPNELTAAHRTLPMPSLVRVTNLDNGRSIVVRINDRGPFAAGRIIDISRRGAQLLGFEGNGVAKVRVSILEPESRALAEGAMKRKPGTALASAPAPAPRQEPVTISDSDLGSAVPQDNIPEIKTVDAGDQMDAPQTASVGAVEEVPLDATPGTAEARENNIVVSEPRASTHLPPVGKMSRPVLKTIPGKRVEGRFYPAPKVEHRAPTPNARIYVQAGAFSVKENAVRLKEKLAKIAPTTITEAKVKGVTFYRVRLGPIKSVDQADKILAKVLGQNAKSARITVE